MSTFSLSTAEAVLQKMDDMKEMRRRRMLAERGASHDGKVDTDLFYSFCTSSVLHRGKFFI